MADVSTRLHGIAASALAAMREAGFEHAQATASALAKEEINIAHNAPSLMRSTKTRRLSLLGLVGGRKASTEFADLDDASAVQGRIAALFAGAGSAPVDDANAVSAGEQGRIVRGPLDSDTRVLADTVDELLAYREREAPKMMLDEAFVAHNRVESCTLTSGGSALECRLGSYEISIAGVARDGKRSSSFASAGGTCDSLVGMPVAARFGIAEMLRDAEQQIETRPIGARFTGSVVLAPSAVEDLVVWLLGQFDDSALIAGTSLYRQRVGQPVASPLLSLSSRFDAPGTVAFSTDGFVARPVDVLAAGTLRTLLPTLYGSRKAGLPHTPVAAAGWQLAAGTTARAAMVGDVVDGAFVGRLSMGRPAANGDFSGVIKNSFAIESGHLAGALSETMITGNVARMLEGVAAVSRERLDTGAWLLPWLSVGGLHFS